MTSFWFFDLHHKIVVHVDSSQEKVNGNEDAEFLMIKMNCNDKFLVF